MLILELLHLHKRRGEKVGSRGGEEEVEVMAAWSSERDIQLCRHMELAVSER